MNNLVNIELNMNNIRFNYLKIREKTKHGNNAIPVIKNNSYGIGYSAVVFALIDIQKKYYVFSIEDAVKLRAQFPILEEIFVLGGIAKGQGEIFLRYKITPVINSYEQLRLWIESGGGKFVLQFNTGMNRSGIELNEIKKVKNLIDKNHLGPMIVMSHLACGDNSDHEETKIQLKNFQFLVDNFKSYNCLFGLSASEGIFYLDTPFCNTSRPGETLYGWKVHPDYNPKPVITITAELYKNKNGETCFPMGINNGIPSNFENPESFLMVGNQKVNVKRVYDWETVLDTNLVGETALILGEKENIGSIEIGQLSKMCGTITQEIQCRLTLNIKKFPEKFKINIIGGFKAECNLPVEKMVSPRATLIKNKNDDLISYRSTILEIRKVNENGFVGYGATAEAKTGDVFATFYNGYADGLERLISNSGSKVYVIGRNSKTVECEIWGRISMDMATIKIPTNECENIVVDCEVIVFDEKHSPNQFVKNTNKTANELFFTTNSERNKKIITN